MTDAPSYWTANEILEYFLSLPLKKNRKRQSTSGNALNDGAPATTFGK